MKNLESVHTVLLKLLPLNGANNEIKTGLFNFYAAIKLSNACNHSSMN